MRKFVLRVRICGLLEVWRMKMNLNRKGKWFILLIFLIPVICACSRQAKEEQGDKYAVYYVNNDETGIYPQEYVTETESTDTEKLLSELLMNWKKPI